MCSLSQNPLISFLVFLSILSSQTIKAIDVYVSSAVSLPGDGSQTLPYSSLVSALNASYVDSSVRILLLSNKNSYIIDSELNITHNLQITYTNGGINAILDFSNKGSLNLNGLFSMVLINIQIQQTSPNYQPTVSALNLVNSLGLNITVTKYFSLLIGNSFLNISSEFHYLRNPRKPNCNFCFRDHQLHFFENPIPQ